MTDLNLELVAIDTLAPDPENARLHDETNMDAITASLRRFGQVKPIVVTNQGKVLAGNGTLAAAIRLGWKQVSIVRAPAEWSEAQATAYAIADNRTAELADWNGKVLASQLVDLAEQGWNLNDLGFAAIPLADVAEVTTSESERNAKDPVIKCPKCGHTWLTSSTKVAAE